MSLLVAPCGSDAASHAVKHWHYARALPQGKKVCFGVWETSGFVGAVVFSQGANWRMGRPYGLGFDECVELTRVALRGHVAPVSQIVADALRQLKSSHSSVQMVISYADPAQGHHGGIYQAGNWVYLGRTPSGYSFRLPDGRLVHKRSYTGVNFMGDALPIPSGARRVKTEGKHRYAYPMNRRMRKQVAPLALPYPHADEDSRGSRLGSTGEGRVRSPASAPTVSRVRS